MTKKPGKNLKKPQRGRTSGTKIAAGLLAALGLAGGIIYWTAPASKLDMAAVKARVPGGERRPTLSPALFTGAVAQAYQVAKEIPQILDQLYCWCKCIENSGHKSNLSCFVDSHAAG